MFSRKKRHHKLWAIVIAVLCAAGAGGAELPVREVVLYKHGVGYFERSGSMGPGETARLDFKASEMNDVLKSLTIQDKSGSVSGLRYDSSIPLDRKLADFPFRVEPGKPLSSFLDQLRGARIELQFGAEKTTGVIVGARVIAAGRDAPEREQVTLLLDSGDLRNLDLAAASALRFSDPKVQGQFKDYLAAVADSRSAEKRSVYVQSGGGKARDVAAAYMIPSPVWKSSYRLVLDHEGGPLLEGWAIVDNTTGEDWTNVRMALVSGKPISFISALYEPKYIQRVAADLPESQAVAPTVHSGVVGGLAAGMASAMPAAPSAGLQQFAKLQFAPGEGGGVGGGAYRVGQGSSVVPQTPGRELGELFEYSIATPVTIRRNESAMLPFIQQKVTARKLLIYSDLNSPHPLQAAELNNATGKTLDGGPITVFDGGAYGGEALVETVKNGDKRLLSYAVDLGTLITTAFDAKSAIVREVHIARGALTARVAQQETRTYTMRNVDAKPKSLIIEHPVRGQYDLLTPKAGERTTSAYRFEVPLPATSTKELAVSEEHVYSTETVVTSLTPDILVTYVENRNLSSTARRELQRILDAKRQIALLETRGRDLQVQIDTLTKDQERIRQNLTALNGVSGQSQQVQTYAAKLASEDTQIAALQSQRNRAQTEESAAQAALNALIGQLDF